jgi:hypothetical protein
MGIKVNEIVNMDGGGVASAAAEERRWYRWSRFPLMPLLHIRKADRWNEWSLHFQWLALSIWTMMSPDIGASVEIDDQGIEARIRVPYLIFMLRLPLFPHWLHQKLWRRGTGS